MSVVIGDEERFGRPGPTNGRRGRSCRGGQDASRIRLAFVNNMPDAAFEATESQFLGLIDSASDNITVEVARYTLPGIERSVETQGYIGRYYASIDELWRDRVDALVVTGTEPLASDLRAEPYWEPLERVIHWAAVSTVSTVLSCLAAHAAVLVFDDIPRRMLERKRSGVFDNAVLHPHPLLEGLDEHIPMPHSRWNDVPDSSLEGHGYRTLLRLTDGGWTMVSKQRGRCLFVLMQGHPEYGTDTLLREYRRDVRRFQEGTSTEYPSLPTGYLEPHHAGRLGAFVSQVRTASESSLATAFPYEDATRGLVNTWQAPAKRIYANWLGHVARASVSAS